MIGKYRDADKTPRPEPQPAWIQVETAVAEAVAAANRAMPASTRGSRRLQTEPLADGDLSIGDSTQPLDLNEVEVGTTIIRVLKRGYQPWEQTLALYPDHPKAPRDIQKARELQQRLKELR